MRFNTEIIEKISKPAGKTYRVELKHKPLSGPRAGKETSVGTLLPNLNEQARAILKTVNKGDVVSIEITKTEDGKYWTLSDIAEREANQETPTQNQKSWDDTGVKVGAARNQAIAFLAATKGTKFTLDDVDQVAYEIVKRQAAQEDNVRNSRIGNHENEQSIANSDITELLGQDEQVDEIPF